VRAVQLHQTGGPEVLTPAEIDTPSPAAGEALVRIEAAGINFIDVYQRTGAYPTALPAVPGMEAAGVVEAVGPDVAEPRPGQRVAYAMQPGAYAEYAVVPAARLVAVPDGLGAELAAAVMLPGMTAHYLAHSTYRLGAGDTALVHAAAGGVGHLLTQLAKLAGARVLATTSTDEKAQLARELGADEVIRYDRTQVADEVARLTDDAGVDVVYDGIGRATFEAGLNSLRPRGCMALFGQASGSVEPVDPQTLNAKGSLFLTRPSLAHYVADRGELTHRAGDLFAWLAAGQMQARTDRSWPLEKAADAHRALESRQTTGKAVLTP
jgi:NADPH2:quinone reductase